MLKARNEGDIYEINNIDGSGSGSDYPLSSLMRKKRKIAGQQSYANADQAFLSFINEYYR